MGNYPIGSKVKKIYRLDGKRVDEHFMGSFYEKTGMETFSMYLRVTRHPTCL